MEKSQFGAYLEDDHDKENKHDQIISEELVHRFEQLKLTQRSHNISEIGDIFKNDQKSVS